MPKTHHKYMDSPLIREFPLARCTSIFYKPYHVLEGVKPYLAMVHNYSSYIVNKTCEGLDAHPILYSGVLMGFLATNCLSLPATAAVVSAMGISYGASSLANEIVKVYGPEYKWHAKFIADVGTAIMYGVCLTMVMGAVMGMLATTQLAVIPAAVLVIPAAAISAAICTQLKRFEKAIEDVGMGKEELEKSLDKKTISIKEELRTAVSGMTVRTTVRSILANMLGVPIELATVIATVTAANFVDYISKADFSLHSDESISKDISKGIRRVVEMESRGILSKVFHTESPLGIAVQEALVVALHEPFEVLIRENYQKIQVKAEPLVKFTKKAMHDIRQTFEKMTKSISEGMGRIR